MDEQNGGPADVAGMRRGDVVVCIDGQKVRSLREVQGIISGHKPGHEVELTYTRRNAFGSIERMTCKVKLARLADLNSEQK